MPKIAINSPSMPSFHQNFAEIVSRYDGFIVDLWGVIHDGVTAYAGAKECLEVIKKKGKNIVFLSNAPRRVSKAVQSLARVGVPDHLYDHVVTSGEVGREHIIQRYPQGGGFFYIGPARDSNLLEGLPQFQELKDESKALFGIITGFDEDDSTIDEKMPQLQVARAHNIPLFCMNPDHVVVRQTGERPLCAGIIGEAYEEMGGTTFYFGKPYKDVYDKAFNLLNVKDKSRIAAIGDSLITDIKGANDLAIDSYLIAGGILGEELGIEHGQLPDAAKFSALCSRYGITPTGLLPAFVW